MSTISFSQIPVDLRTPGQYLEVDASRARQGLPTMRQRVLLLGQKTGTGVAAGQKLVRVLSQSQADKAFGPMSQLSYMVEAFRAANTSTELWAMAMPTTGATQAVGSLTFAGTATEGGTLNLMIGGRVTSVAVASGETAETVAARVHSTINAQTRRMVSPSVAGAVVTLTALAGFTGVAGSSIDLREGYYDTNGGSVPAGLTLTIAAMSGGTGGVVLDNLPTLLGDEWFQTIVMPSPILSELTKLVTLLNSRFGPMVQLEGMVYTAASGNLATLLSNGALTNSQHVCLVGAGRSPTPPWEWASQVAAVDVGEPDPARPRQGITLPTMLAPARGVRLTREERDVLLHGGVSTYKVQAGGVVELERLITMYQTDSFGGVDTSYLDVETMRTLAYLRYSLRARIAQKYPRHKLANDGTNYAPGQAVVTPSVLRGELLALAREWEYAGLVEGFDQFKADLLVERDTDDPNRVNAVIPPDMVNQFRVFAGLVQFRR